MSLWDIILTANSNLWRSKLRTTLTIIAIFIGALTLTLTRGIGSGISSYIDSQLGNLGAKDALIITASQGGTQNDQPKKYDPSRKTVSASGFGGQAAVLTQADIDKIKAHDHIKSVQPRRAVVVDYIQGVNDQKYQITVSQFVGGTKVNLAAGKVIDDSSNDFHIILPLNFVSPLGFSSASDAVGKTVMFGVTNALGQSSQIKTTVAGVEQKGLTAGNGATLNSALTQKIYDEETVGLPAASKDQYALAIARFDTSITPAQLNDLKDSLKKQGYQAMTIEDTIGLFKQVVDGIIAVLNFFAIIALVAASFGIINTLLMAVQERTKEIGLMKAMGMGSSRIFLLFSIEAVLIGFWGSALGVVVAYGVGQIANHIVSTGFLKDLVGLHLLTFPWQSIVEVMVLIMVIAFLAGTLPARRASRQSPIDALRYE